MTHQVKREPFLMKCARHVAACVPKGKRTILAAFARFCGGNEPFIARVGPNLLLIDLRDLVCRWVYTEGAFEPVIMGLISSLLNPGDVFLDVGANFGVMTLHAARRVGASGKVYSFEPDPRNLYRLRTNIELNDLKHVEAIAAAVYNHAGTCSFRISADGNMGTASIARDGDSAGTVVVPTIRLDDFIQEHRIPQVGLIKMDIEGAELEAIEGACESFKSRKIKALVLELHESILGPERLAAVLKLIRNSGYTIYLVHKSAAATFTPASLELLPNGLQQVPVENPHRRTEPHLLLTAVPLDLSMLAGKC